MSNERKRTDPMDHVTQCPTLAPLPFGESEDLTKLMFIFQFDQGNLFTSTKCFSFLICKNEMSENLALCKLGDKCLLGILEQKNKSSIKIMNSNSSSSPHLAKIKMLFSMCQNCLMRETGMKRMAFKSVTNAQDIPLFRSNKLSQRLLVFLK